MDSPSGSGDSYDGERRLPKEAPDELEELRPKLHPNQSLIPEQSSVPDHSEEDTRLLLEYLVQAKNTLICFLEGEKDQDLKDGGEEKPKKQKKIREAEARSISTGASLDGVFLDRKNPPNSAFKNVDFKCEESENFCRNISKRLNQWKNEVIEHGTRVNASLLNFLAFYLVHNFIELAEVDIFFELFGSLIDPSSEKVYLTESAFAKLFYDVLLRLNFECATESFYRCLERSVIYLNKHLRNIQLTPFGGLKLIGDSRVIGYEAIVHVHLYSSHQTVKELSKKFLYNLFLAEVERKQKADRVVLEDLIEPCRSVMAVEYEKLASDPSSIQVILSGVNLISDVLRAVFGEKSGTGASQGSTVQAKQAASRANGTLIKVIVENHTTVQKNKIMEISISVYDTVRSLKNQVLEMFGTFADSDVFFMSKGRMVYELEKSLKELGVTDGQKVQMYTNEEERQAEEYMLSQKPSKIAQVKEVLPEVSEDIISFTLTTNGDDVPAAISQLSDGGSFFVGEELEVIEKRKRELSRATQQDGLSEADLRRLQTTLSQSENLYELIFKLMKLEHYLLKNNLWNLLIMLPLLHSAKQEIESQTKGELAQGGFDFVEQEMGVQVSQGGSRRPWRVEVDQMVQNLASDTTCYQIHVLANIVRESSDELLHEWLLMEGTLANFGMIFQGRNFLPNPASKMDIELVTEQPIKQLSLSPVDEFCKTHSRFFCSLAVLFKELNKKYLNPPALKTYIPRVDQLVPMLLRELDQNKEFDPSQGEPHHFYAEMYSQIIESNDFIKEMECLSVNLINQAQEVSPLFQSLYEDCLVLVLSFVLDYYSATKNQPKITALLQKLIEKTVVLATTQYLAMANLFMNISAYYICLNNHEATSLTWLCNLLSNPTAEANDREYLLVVTVTYALLELFEKKITRVTGLESQASGLLVEFVMALAKKYKAYVEIRLAHNFLQGESVQFLNELTNTLKLVVRILRAVNPLFHTLEVLVHFRAEIVEEAIYSLFLEPESPFASVVVDQHCKLRVNFYEILIYFYEKDWRLSLDFMNRIRIFYQEPDFKSSSLNYVDYRRKSAYIGIRNLGSTCYANSLLQQFFHNRRIREFIHSLPIDISKQMDSMSGNGVLKELMLLFGQLALNKSSQADLTGFTCKFTGFDGMPINVKVQQDVNEFFNLLLDCLERELTALELPNNEDAFKSELGGTFLNEITSMDLHYDYSTSNEEHFNTITLDVKNVHSMQNGLERFFQPTIFDGDNKLNVDQYQTKIVAKKNTWLSKDLPKTLVVMLKRFEYDMKNYTRYKLNDYFEFPLELNLQKWVKHGTASESIEVLGDGALYSYKLKGVLVHSGSSEFGHYYSYIFVDGKWMEFNDTKVAEFDPTPENIRKEWFGGDSEDAKNFTSAGRQSSKSAYILFYERIHRDGQISNSTHNTENRPLADHCISRPVRQIIEDENSAFVRKKVFSDGLTLRFLNELLDKLDNDEGIEALAKCLIDFEEPENLKIKDEEFYGFLHHLRSIVLNKLGSRYEILKPLTNALNDMGNDIKAVYVDEYIPNQDVLNKIAMDSEGNSRKGVTYGAGMCFESFNNSTKGQKAQADGASPDVLGSPTAEGILMPNGEQLTSAEYELIEESLKAQGN